jgi:hypothetical protein
MTFIQIVIIYKTTFILVTIMRRTTVVLSHMYSKLNFSYALYIQLVSDYHANIHTYTSVVYIQFIHALPLNNPAPAYLAPSSCGASGPPQFQVACKLSPCPPLLPIVPCIPPSWASRNPNVLLIRTHPNPLSQCSEQYSTHSIQAWDKAVSTSEKIDLEKKC